MSHDQVIVSQYSQETPLTDICLVCKNNEKLYYSKYQLCRDSIYFLAVLKEDKNVREIPLLEYEQSTVAVLLSIIDDKFNSKKVDNIDFVELYKLSFYTDHKIGLEISIDLVTKLKCITPEIYYTLKQYKFPLIEKLINIVIDTITNDNGDTIINDICKHYEEKCLNINKDTRYKILNIPNHHSLAGMSIEFKNIITQLIDRNFPDKKIIALKYRDGEFKGQHYFNDIFMECQYLVSNEGKVIGKIENGVKLALDLKDKNRLENYWNVTHN